VTRMTWCDVASPYKFYQRHQFFGQIRIYLVHRDCPRCSFQWCPAWCPPAGDMTLVLQNRGVLWFCVLFNNRMFCVCIVVSLCKLFHTDVWYLSCCALFC
jgi:hypothetical protein